MKKFSASIFVLIFVCFFLPFITISCQNQPVARLNGFGLAVGTTINAPSPMGGVGQPKHINAEPLAKGALLCATVGIATSFLKRKNQAIIPAVAGGSGALLLFFLKGKLDDDILRQGSGLLINFESGYWFTLLLFIGATAINGFAYAESRKELPVVVDKEGKDPEPSPVFKDIPPLE